MDAMKIALLQTVSSTRVEDNLDTAAALVGEAAAAGARLAVLPEYFCFMGRKDVDKLAIAEADGAGPIQDRLASIARTHGVWLVGGTLPIRDEAAADSPSGGPGRARNACCVWSPEGERIARYDKIHLFRFSDGSESYDEGRTLVAGSTPVAFEADGWRVGLSVCYDLRFPELYRALMRPAPCDLLLVPSAFTVPTGRAHWELLLRARAVENQTYVAAAAQGGTHENGRTTWGHSLVADPWGTVVAERAEPGAGIVCHVLERDRIAAARGKLPALEHRRADLPHAADVGR
jgi:nitrilase